MKEQQFQIEYQYVQDDKALEDVFTYIFDEIQKVINSDQSNEQKVQVNTTIV